VITAEEACGNLIVSESVNKTIIIFYHYIEKKFRELLKFIGAPLSKFKIAQSNFSRILLNWMIRIVQSYST